MASLRESGNEPAGSLKAISSKKKPPGQVRNVRKPDNIERVRVIVTRSPHRSARRQTIALRLSERSVRRILHSDLKFHPYKLMIVQQLNEEDYDQCRRLRGMDRQIVWFQQDGATVHRAKNSMTVLCRMFPGHIISRRSDIPCPPLSLDLTVCDYFLWSYLKSKGCVNRHRTTDDMKIAFAQEIARRNFRERFEEYVERDGHHLKDIISKTI
ncbi:hypothetical protein ANN_24832 [Periplaneta americana]|uniref:Tc1-like transposase DDE domain-containing protein n=1 Tax=Periplaneta americana TaxID=6978 RepID=A0ABQ8S087_PERAM|nr:hypothetical protein ANN_24832 [Periplaneta americana]